MDNELGVFVAGVITGFIAAVVIYIFVLKGQDLLSQQRRKSRAEMFVSAKSVKAMTAVKLEDEDFYEPFISVDPIIRANSGKL